VSHEQFRRVMRELRGEASFRRFARLLHYDAAQVNRVENGAQRPSLGLAKALDHYAGGDRFAALLLDDGAAHHVVRRDQGSPWEVLDVMRRLRSSDLGDGTLDSLAHGVHQLCRQYPYRAAAELRADSLELMRMVARLRSGRLTYREHRELLDSAAWLALLVGCVEYDLGLSAPAETTRHAAAALGKETGNGEIQAWAHEMACWFALTQGRLPEVIDHARAGRSLASHSGVAVQLAAHEARAIARMGDRKATRAVLDEGRRALDRQPVPAHPEHHFVIDPDKWDFYAMDCARVAGDNDLAAEHANEVIRVGQLPDGSQKWPMRTAEARIALAIVAVRSGDLDKAIGEAAAALAGNRQSKPSLLASATELDNELTRRYPHEPGVAQWHESFTALHQAATTAQRAG
jgi:hypothetical protein